MATLASASDATKYAANSTGWGSRGPSSASDRRGHRCPLGQRVQRDVEAVLQRGRMDAAGELAQLLQRLGQLVARGAHELLGLLRVATDLAPDQRELQRERDQPLLGAVVQVALDAAPLGVGRGDDALAGGLQLGEPRA